MFYLVRHAKAGSRANWEGDDRDRPLSAAGLRQAAALAARLAPLTHGALVSSPSLRCVQTIEPLAASLGTTVLSDERLAEGAGFVGALALLSELPDGSVLCSHGDVIPDTIGALQRRGCAFAGTPDWRKASVWVLGRDADGAITRAACWPPPEV
ncbi:MAG: phosphoglycerate mutase family protein [Actinomycetota bacterium]|nr:phosphoglycerate mutase family protein [Actinomycetota bacterium]